MKTLLKKFVNSLGLPVYWLRQSAKEGTASLIRIWAVLPWQRSAIRRLFSKKDVVRLNFGCGDTDYPGWIGVDCNLGRQQRILLDLRRPLPFPDDSVDLCYSSHFVEHLTPEEGQLHVAEVHRILRRGGTYRVVLPDAIEFVRRYLDGDLEFFRKAFPWADRPMQAIYAVANWNGEHRNIIDFDELRLMGERAGFAKVERSQANASQNADLRIDSTDPQRIAESFYAELHKARA